MIVSHPAGKLIESCAVGPRQRSQVSDSKRLIERELAEKCGEHPALLGPVRATISGRFCAVSCVFQAASSSDASTGAGGGTLVRSRAIVPTGPSPVARRAALRRATCSLATSVAT